VEADEGTQNGRIALARAAERAGIDPEAAQNDLVTSDVEITVRGPAFGFPSAFCLLPSALL
jgi:hypothetical protein